MKDKSVFSFQNFFAKFAVFGFIDSALVHLSTFIGFNATSRVYGIWLLHIGIFLVVIPMAVSKMLVNEN